MTGIKDIPTSHQARLENHGSRSNHLPMLFGVLLALGIYWMMISETAAFRDLGALLLLFVSTILVLRRPVWGVVLTIISLTLIEVIYRSSYTQYYLLIVGGLTVVSYFLHNTSPRKFQQRSEQVGIRSSIYIWAFLFIFWSFVTYPQAILFLGDRIWLLTLTQLMLLTWLAGKLFDTPEKHRLLMVAIVLATSLSAIIALQEAYIGNTFGASARASGLAGSANTTVRLFIYAIVLLSFLMRSVKTRFFQLAGIFGLVILVSGVVATVSRSGFLLLLVASAMIFWGELTKKIRASMLITFMAISIIAILFVPDSYWTFMVQDAPVSVMEGTDTIGLRYRLWQIAWQMWLDHPFAGVGIGQFQSVSPFYGAPPHRGIGIYLGVHSMYFALLAENGIVGLAFYAGLMISAITQLIRISRCQHSEWSDLARTWLNILLLVLIGGITKTDHYDKFPWLIPGLALAISRAFHQKQQEEE
jgi:O-antigen ligase